MSSAAGNTSPKHSPLEESPPWKIDRRHHGADDMISIPSRHNRSNSTNSVNSSSTIHSTQAELMSIGAPSVHEKDDQYTEELNKIKDKIKTDDNRRKKRKSTLSKPKEQLYQGGSPHSASPNTNNSSTNNNDHQKAKADTQMLTHDTAEQQPRSSSSEEQEELAAPEEEADDILQCPKDKYYMAYIIFIILGVGSLLPGAIFLFAIDFFRFIYPSYNKMTEYLLSFGFNTAQVIAVTFLILLGRRVGSVTIRIYAFFAINFFLLVMMVAVNCTALIISGDGDSDSKSLFYHVLYWAAVIFNALSGIAAGGIVASLFGLSAIFPWKYTEGVSSGIAFAGVLASGIRFFIKYVLQSVPHALSVSTISFFGLAACSQLICILAYFVLGRLPLTKYCVDRNVKLQNKYYNSLSGDMSSIGTLLYRSPQSINDDREEAEEIQEGYFAEAPRPKRHKMPTFIVVLRKIFFAAAGIFVTFFTTYSLMPGVISDFDAAASGYFHKSPENKALFIILLFTTFYLGDALGRMSPTWRITIKFNEKQLWVVILLRLLFFVLIALVAKYGQAIIDVWKFVLVALMAVTHGFCASLGMMQGPELVDSHEKEQAGFMMTLSTNLGLFAGSCFALLLGFLVTL